MLGLKGLRGIKFRMVKGSGKMSMKFDTRLEQFLKNLQRALDYYNTQDYIWTWLFLA